MMEELRWIVSGLSNHEAALVGVVLWVRMGSVLRRVIRLEQRHGLDRRTMNEPAWAP